MFALANTAVLREGEGLVADDRRVRARREPVHRYAALCARISSSMRDTFAAATAAGSEAVHRYAALCARFSSSMRDTFAAATVSSYCFRLHYYCFT